MASERTDVLERIRTFNSSLDRLMRLYTGDTVSSTEFARIVTNEACDLLGTQRVSAWSFDEAQTKIECIDLYLSQEGEHQSGITLFAKDFPRYFDAVLTEREIAANDASQDPRTSEFTEVYLRPNKIISMLDAQIRSAAGPRGVVCIETVDVFHQWSPDEIAYAVSIAELIGFFMDREDRRHVLAQLEDSNKRLAEAVATAQEAHERYDLAVKAAFDGVWDFDPATDEVFYSDQNFSLLGESYDTPPSSLKWWQDRVHPDDVQRVLNALEAHIDRDIPYNETYRLQHSDGTWRWWRSRGQAVRDEHGNTTRIVGTNSDVTDLIQMQTELEKRNQQLLLAKKEIEGSALHDALTGLPNRRYLDRICDDFRSDRERPSIHVSVLHIDLDFFKEVNDKFGHAVGDKTLKRVAKHLRSLINEGEFVARIGGDEFIAILADGEDASRAIEFSTQLNMLLDNPFIIDSMAFEIGASIGIAVCLSDNIDIWHVLGNADLALYEAKKSGRKTYRLFNRELEDLAIFARNTKAELKSALDDGAEVIPYFQPQFATDTLELVGFEVLARWEHPTRGLLTPDDFLGFAHDLNCVADIDRQILNKSVEHAREWASLGLTVPKLSVNVSNERLQDLSLLHCVEDLGNDAKIFSFELLESTFLDDINEQVAAALDRLRELGIDFEIDDFGSGYASILSLINVRPARLKIDKTLIRNVGSDLDMSSLVQSIVDIARTLNIKVVAEGVENSRQLTTLAEIGCDVVQGFGLAKPMSSDCVIETYLGREHATQLRAG